jgi:hypothetical protein
MEDRIRQAIQSLDSIVNIQVSRQHDSTKHEQHNISTPLSSPFLTTYSIMKRLKRTRELEALSAKSRTIIQKMYGFPFDEAAIQRSSSSSFRPFHRVDYVRRLSSYTIQKWLYPPSLLSATECSRYGWQAIQWHRLQCVHCKSQLSVDVHESLWSHKKALENLSKHFQSQLVTAHLETCPWKYHPSPGKLRDTKSLL